MESSAARLSRTPFAAPDTRAVEEELDLAIQSRAGRVVLLRGPAGVGRTSLLRALEQRAQARSVSVVSAQATRPICRPFGLLEPLLRACTERLRAIDGGHVNPAATSNDATGIVLRAVRDTPTLILLDDVDASDASSLAAIQQLVASLTTPPALRPAEDSLAGCLLILSARDESLSPGLEECARNARTITLSALDLDGVRSYLAQGEAAQRLLDATGGLPGRLNEVLSGAAPVDLARRRVEQLASAELHLLRALALAGHPVSAELVNAATGRKDAVQRLAKLAAARFVDASPGVGRSLFSVARESDRHALLESWSEDEARSLHVAWGKAFEAAGDNAAAFEQFASAADTAPAAVVGLAAARRLIDRSAWEAADTILARLVALRPAPEHLSPALLLLATAREKRGDVRGALAALGRARPLLSAPAQRDLRARCARLCLQLGAPRPAERLAHAVLASSGSPDATVALAEARFLRGAYDEAIALTATAVPPEHQFLLGNVHGKALLTLGRLEEARDVFQANAALAEQHGFPQEKARGLLNVGVVAHRQGAREEARSAYRAALASTSPFTAIVHANLSSLALEDGHADEALAEGQRALAAFARDGRLKEQAHATQNLCRVYLYLGDTARAGEVAAHAAALAERVGDPYLHAGAALVAAEVKLATGDDAAEQFAAVADEFERVRNPRYLCESLLLLAESHLARKRWDKAGDALDRARAAGASGAGPLTAQFELSSSELALASDRVDQAAAALSAARTALVSAPHLELPARLYLLAGQIAERRGDLSLAQAERQRAARIVEELSARVPPERRGLFLSRTSRRAALDAAGHIWPLPSAPIAPPARSESRANALIGQSPAIARINGLIARLGPSSTTVLLRGESGTGKELAARALHANSSRKDLPLIAVNCGALSEELLLSELFGHERGAFTGAVRDRKGRFELADGGTIFLDEIGDISPRAQVALLRVLQERTFERVGGTRTLSVDVRVICATNRNLEELMARDRFREDLYYRLRGASLTLPPLRERLVDLPALCDHFFARYSRERGEPARALSPEARRLLQRHRWPGNIRELFNTLESAIALASGLVVGPEAFELFPELFEAAPAPEAGEPGLADPSSADIYTLMRSKDISLKDLRRQLDITCISQALAEGSGNISEAARLLKMKRSRLSQIVNAEPELRALCRGGTGPVDASDDEGD